MTASGQPDTALSWLRTSTSRLGAIVTKSLARVLRGQRLPAPTRRPAG